MRTKFRGKLNPQIGTESWVYGDLLHFYSGKTCIQNCDNDGCHRYTVIPESVGQFTGIEVKNSMELYLGDIFHMGDVNIKYQVVWYDCGFKGKHIGSNANYVGLDFWENEITVIGNIYENKNLIEP